MQAEEKGLELFVNNAIPEMTLLIDKDRIGQVIFNIAGNAVKYTNTGSVSISISFDGSLQISVSDTGIGMDEENLKGIFKPFSQIYTEGAAKNRGLGLGLAIVKLIVDTFSGTIDVESVPGRGSTFTVTIPCREVEPAAGIPSGSDTGISARTDLDMDNLSVLITEDDQINRVYLERILQKKGWSVDVSENGNDAVEKTKLKHYDVIFMDLNLPGIDGLKASEMIRDFESRHNLVRSAIIAVTAHAYPEDMAGCMDSGMDGYLSKPFSAKKLMDEIKKVLGIL
jgi:CheY-like chemotaxis protein/anti-sigma regulatory factor (Ser/Thr protein kinase)